MTITKTFLVKDEDNSWLDHTSSSGTTTRGIIKASKCNIIAEKSSFNYRLLIKGTVTKNDPVEYEFNATGPVIDAIIRFLSNEAETCEEYTVIQSGQTWNIKCMPSGKTLATIELKDDETVISQSWLGEEVKE